MATYSRKVEYLVRKRHRMLKHVMSMLTEEGGFWMNSVYINKDSICRLSGGIGDNGYGYSTSAKGYES